MTTILKIDDSVIGSRFREIFNTLLVIKSDTDYIDNFYEFEPYENLLRRLRREVRSMVTDNNFLLETDQITMQPMISAVLSVITRKKSRLSRRSEKRG